jgi:hypothetical protein
MQRSLFIRAFLFACLTVCAPAHTSVRVSPADVKLTIRTQGNQSAFHIGEIIPLQLVFTSVSPGKYQIDTASYDRSGRLNEETFVVEPKSAWDDPLDLYFRSYSAFLGGGLRGSKLLSNEPTLILLELNEWVRFRSPGRYRVRVVSGRVFAAAPTAGSVASLSVPSNELELTIIPATKEWQESALKAAVNVLNASKPSPGTASDQADPRRQAVKTLRYLGTEGAARQMAHRLSGSEWDWDLTAGLVGSTAREAGLQEMKKLLRDPNFPVTDRFLSAMSVLSLPEDSVEKIPELREEAESQFRQELISAIAEKRGPALAISTNTIVEEAAIRSRPLPAELKRTLTQQLIATFDKLPIEKQAELLQYRWSALDHREMLPLLRRIAMRYQDFPELRQMDAYQFNNASAAALKHWYEMAPDEARPIIIKEILRPKPRFNANVLGILPDKELPEVDQTLVDNLSPRQDLDLLGNVATLIHRYSTQAVEPEITAFINQTLGKFACAVQEPLLAYLLRVDPEEARPRLEEAMAAKGEGFSQCNHSLLPEVAKLQNHSMLQEIAIKSLDDSDPQIVGSAAAYLMEYGSNAAEDALWSRFTAWSEQWKGQEQELLYGKGSDGQNEAGAGSNLLQALASGQGWLADETKLRRLVDMSIGPQQRQQAEQYLGTWRSRPWYIQVISLDEGRFEIMQYHARSIEAAREKLLQFPRGSTFQWSGSGQEGDDKVFQDLSNFASQHELKVIAAHN